MNDTIHTISDEALRKIFNEVKSNDFTEAQFEHEKSLRIAALSEALKGAGAWRDERATIMERLIAVCDSKYSRDLFLHKP